MSETDLELDLEDLVSAEDFLNYFAIPFDQTTVHVYRLHILQRFHDYLLSLSDICSFSSANLILDKVLLYNVLHSLLYYLK